MRASFACNEAFIIANINYKQNPTRILTSNIFTTILHISYTPPNLINIQGHEPEGAYIVPCCCVLGDKKEDNSIHL